MKAVERMLRTAGLILAGALIFASLTTSCALSRTAVETAGDIRNARPFLVEASARYVAAAGRATGLARSAAFSAEQRRALTDLSGRLSAALLAAHDGDVTAWRLAAIRLDLEAFEDTIERAAAR